MQYYLYCQPQESQEYKLGEELRREQNKSFFAVEVKKY